MSRSGVAFDAYNRDGDHATVRIVEYGSTWAVVETSDGVHYEHGRWPRYDDADAHAQDVADGLANAGFVIDADAHMAAELQATAADLSESAGYCATRAGFLAYVILGSPPTLPDVYDGHDQQIPRREGLGNKGHLMRPDEERYNAYGSA